LKGRGYSQVPVLDGDRVAGIVNERDLLNFMVQGGDASAPVSEIMETEFAVVEPANKVSMLSRFFTKDLTVLVLDNGRLAGVITKIDYIDFVSRNLP
ncbi:MAG: CBS domain-containing protein, partial [Myxococcales bacterium]|nr:CBS domain-containing protein [Myxococcales bacterium]